ncbi:MAG: hypothetical protein H6Q70_1244 [Firmicutes bacterium]|nr:hypothetical protein [Bacillota bacterium]
MGISNISSASKSIPDTQSTVAALQRKKMLLQSKVSQLVKQPDTEKIEATIKDYEKQIEHIDELIRKTNESSSNTNSENQTDQSDKINLSKKFGPPYSVELTGQKDTSDSVITDTVASTPAYSVELSSENDDRIENIKMEQEEKDIQEIKKKDPITA